MLKNHCFITITFVLFYLELYADFALITGLKIQIIIFIIIISIIFITLTFIIIIIIIIVIIIIVIFIFIIIIIIIIIENSSTTLYLDNIPLTFRRLSNDSL